MSSLIILISTLKNAHPVCFVFNRVHKRITRSTTHFHQHVHFAGNFFFKQISQESSLSWMKLSLHSLLSIKTYTVHAQVKMSRVQLKRNS